MLIQRRFHKIAVSHDTLYTLLCGIGCCAGVGCLDVGVNADTT